MKIVTWNVNSVKVRLDRLLALLGRESPDVLCLQETKIADEAFPREPFERAGYRLAVHGQRTYNGVAILSRDELGCVTCGLGDEVADDQARLLAADLGEVRIFCAYVPNGATVGSDKWAYKLAWLARLRQTLQRTCEPGGRVVVCGDLNVATRDEDVAHPDAWARTVLCHPDVRGALADLMDWGLVDVFARLHPDGGVYSWWDYRGGAFHKNDGLRIDHVLATAAQADRATSARVDRDERKGTRDDKPSDHAPVIVEFA
jgi:exodeoxyribonuclease-3